MGILSGRRQGAGAPSADAESDADLAPLVRWALREQVSGQEPAAAVWQGVQGRVAGGRSRHARVTWHLTTALSAVVVAVLVLTIGMAYSVDEPNLHLITATVEPTGAVEPAVADLTLPLAAASSIMRVLPLPVVEGDGAAASTPASVPVVEQPRVVKPVDVQDDALKPIRRFRLTLVPTVSAPPGAVVYMVVRGEPPMPM